MEKSLNSLILTSLLFLVPVHTNTFVRAQPSQTSTPTSSKKIFIKEELYFGLSKLGGDTISELEWQLFLNRVVTPRFRDGLTVIDVYGQYLNSSGKLTAAEIELIAEIWRPWRAVATRLLWHYYLSEKPFCAVS